MNFWISVNINKVDKFVIGQFEMCLWGCHLF